MGKTSKKHVLLVFPGLTRENAERFGGVMRYLYTHRAEWSVRISVSKLGRPPDRFTLRTEFDTGVDGVLLCCVSDRVTQEIVREHGVPLVSMDMNRHLLHAPDGIRSADVSADETDLAKKAVAHLTRNGGYGSYAYVDFPPVLPWSEARAKAFCARLAARGLGATVIRSQVGLKRLRDLPKPTAVLAANDGIANILVQQLKSMGLRVPDEVAILSVDNEPAICDLADPPLSSIEIDFASCGYKAAALMTSLLGGRRVRPVTAYGAKGICERKSTAPASPVSSLIREADAYISRNAGRPYNVTDLARALKVSRRLLDLRYRQIKQTSVLKAIHASRISRAKELLTGTRQPIAAIANLCGFPDPKRLMRLFKSATGVSMRDWRRASAQ